MRSALSRRAFVAAAALGPVVGDVLARAPAAEAAQAPQVEVLVIQHTWSSLLHQRIAAFRGPAGQTASMTETDVSPGVLLSQGRAHADVVMYRTLDEEDLLLSSGVLRPEAAADMGAAPQAPALVAAAAETSRLGSPVTTGGPALFAHAGMLEELGGEPRLETFDDVYAAAYQLNGSGSRVGIVVSDEMTVVVPILYSFGGAVAEYGRSTLGSAGSDAMYAYLGQMLRDCAAGRDSLLRPDDAIGAFASGEAAILLAQSELDLAVRARTRPDLVDGVRRFPVPAGPDGRVVSTLPAWSLGVSRQARDAAAAEAFIRWATVEPTAANENAGTEPAAPLLSLANGSMLTEAPVGVDPRRIAEDDVALVTNESAHAVRAPLAASAAGLDVAASQEKSAQVIDALLTSP